ncbi:MAG: hypothetical protein WC476_01535 [Phycisphaerae bacterium]|jgi:hypothetical protein
MQLEWSEEYCIPIVHCNHCNQDVIFSSIQTDEDSFLFYCSNCFCSYLQEEDAELLGYISQGELVDLGFEIVLDNAPEDEVEKLWADVRDEF